MKLTFSTIACILLISTAQATTMDFCVVKDINETNTEELLWVLQEGPTVTVREAQAFCKEAQQSFGRLTLIEHKVATISMPTNLTYTISLGTKPTGPINTNIYLLQSEKRGLCTLSMEQHKTPGFNWPIWFIELKGNEITQQSASPRTRSPERRNEP